MLLTFCMQNITSSFTFSLRYCKLVIWHTFNAWLHTPKVILSACRKHLSLPACKLNPPYFSGDTVKICKLLILGTLGMPGMQKKHTNLGVILGPICPNLGKNEFSWKKELWQFLIFQLSIR